MPFDQQLPQFQLSAQQAKSLRVNPSGPTTTTTQNSHSLGPQLLTQTGNGIQTQKINNLV